MQTSLTKYVPLLWRGWCSNLIATADWSKLMESDLCGHILALSGTCQPRHKMMRPHLPALHPPNSHPSLGPQRVSLPDQRSHGDPGHKLLPALFRGDDDDDDDDGDGAEVLEDVVKATEMITLSDDGYGGVRWPWCQ